MHDALGQLHAALHAAGKSLDLLMRALCQTYTREHLLHPGFQHRAGQSIQVALMAQVFSRGELHIHAGGLKDNTNLAAHQAGVAAQVEPGNSGIAGGGQHKRGKDAEERGLAAAVGA